MTLPTINLLSTRGMTWHHPVNLGQSSQGFNRPFKVQLTWGSLVKISRNLSIAELTWGKSPSPSLGAFECQSQGFGTVQVSWQYHKASGARGSDETSPKSFWKEIQASSRRCHLSSRPTTGFISPTTSGFPSLSLPLQLLQFKGPQLLFSSRLLCNLQQVTAKSGPDPISVQLRLLSRATDKRDF